MEHQDVMTTSNWAQGQRVSQLSAPLAVLFANPPPAEIFKSTKALTEEDHCRALREMEAVLVIGRVFTVIAQREQCFISGIRPVAKRLMMVMLRAQDILVLSKTALQNGKLERVSRPVASLSALGQRALRRAFIEAERRLCGNVTGADGEGNVSGAPVLWSETDGICFICDLRVFCNDDVTPGFRERMPEFKEVFFEVAFAPMWERIHDQPKTTPSGACRGGRTCQATAHED